MGTCHGVAFLAKARKRSNHDKSPSRVHAELASSKQTSAICLQIRPYLEENAQTRPILQAKLRRATSVLWWVTTREYVVLYFSLGGAPCEGNCFESLCLGPWQFNLG